MANFIFGGCDTVYLAKKYKTPLYVISEDYIVDRCNEIKRDFLNKYENTFCAYASKAFLTKEMVRIIKREGLGLDVVSGGELYTALKVDFPAENIIFHGNNKTIDEIEMAVMNDVGRIVVDNVQELDVIDRIAKRFNKKVNILLRVTPGVEVHTHKFIQTGQVDSKFGIPLREELIKEAVLKAADLENISLLGFHFHLGSQIHENNGYIMAVQKILFLIKTLRDELGFITQELNTGGGFGIQYEKYEERKPISYFTDAIMESVIEGCKKYGLRRPRVIIEPGRWIVGEAGITLYTVGFIKEIPGVRTYVGIDGGMSDNPRTSLYNAKYEAVVANKYDEKPRKKVTIAGNCCESGDILIWDLKVPEIEPGDILAVLSTGAYNYSMASNYNRHPKPAVVMVSKGKDRLIVQRQTYEDIIRNEL
jgi:diaminopimelate decarboxylase